MMRFPIAQIAAITLLVAGALVLFHGWTGVPGGASYRHNIPWIEGFHAAFWSGDLYPRRISGLWYGLGGLDFYFYAPVPFWVSSLAGPVLAPGQGADGALAAGGAVMIALSVVSFHAFARQFYSHRLALAGALIYAILPYHYMTNWFIRQAVGEVAAMAIIPLVALGAVKLLKTPRSGGRLLACSFAALTFSHLPSALLTLFFIAVIVTILIVRDRQSWADAARRAAPFALWGGLGAALAALYWLPALVLLKDVSPDLLFNAYATPTNWFVLDGRPEPNSVTMSVVRMQLAAAVLAALALVCLRRKASKNAMAWALGPLVFGLVMMTPISTPLWTHTPLQAVQFPWRSNVIVDLGLALALCEIARQWASAQKGRAMPAALGGALLLAIMATGATALPHAGAAIERGHMLDGASPATGAAEYIPPGTFRAINARYLAADPNGRSSESQYNSWFYHAERVRDEALANAASDAASVTLLNVSGQTVRVSVDMGVDSGDLRVPVPYWRHWQARLDASGKELSLRPDTDLGMTMITLPAGQSRVTLHLPPTAIERLASAISLLAVFLLGASFLVRRAHHIRLQRPVKRRLDAAVKAG